MKRLPLNRRKSLVHSTVAGGMLIGGPHGITVVAFKTASMYAGGCNWNSREIPIYTSLSTHTLMVPVIAN